MKSARLILLLFSFTLLMTFNLHADRIESAHLELKKRIDPALVGDWEGSAVGVQMEGVKISWIQHRYKDGTFRLELTIEYPATDTEEQRTDYSEESGTWWIEDGLFHEFHSSSGLTDIYNYTILDDDHVLFSSESMAQLMEVDTYEFIDSRIK